MLVEAITKARLTFSRVEIKKRKTRCAGYGVSKVIQPGVVDRLYRFQVLCVILGPSTGTLFSLSIEVACSPRQCVKRCAKHSCSQYASAATASQLHLIRRHVQGFAAHGTRICATQVTCFPRQRSGQIGRGCLTACMPEKARALLTTNTT